MKELHQTTMAQMNEILTPNSRRNGSNCGSSIELSGSNGITAATDRARAARVTKKLVPHLKGSESRCPLFCPKRSPSSLTLAERHPYNQ